MIKDFEYYLNTEITKSYDNHDTGKAHELRRVLIKFKELAKKDLKMIENISTNFSVGQADYTIRLKLEKDLEEVSK